MEDFICCSSPLPEWKSPAASAQARWNEKQSCLQFNKASCTGPSYAHFPSFGCKVVPGTMGSIISSTVKKKHDCLCSVLSQDEKPLPHFWCLTTTCVTCDKSPELSSSLTTAVCIASLSTKKTKKKSTQIRCGHKYLDAKKTLSNFSSGQQKKRQTVRTTWLEMGKCRDIADSTRVLYSEAILHCKTQ